MYERAGFRRELEGDLGVPGIAILAYAAEL